MTTGRKPDFRVGVMNKQTDVKNNSAGAAWQNPDGTINVYLEGFMVLHTSRDLIITLFPNKKDPS